MSKKEKKKRLVIGENNYNESENLWRSEYESDFRNQKDEREVKYGWKLWNIKRIEEDQLIWVMNQIHIETWFWVGDFGYNREIVVSMVEKK